MTEVSYDAEIHEGISPKEFIVGYNVKEYKEDVLGFFTFEQKGGLNSESSFNNWCGFRRNDNKPIKFTNGWSTGFKLSGLNRRWSSRARNTDIILVSHPLCKISFELSLDNFMMLCESCVIKNGEFMEPLLLTKSRELVNLKFYNELLKEQIKKENKLKERTNSKVPAKNQKVGQLYKDFKTGNSILYLGPVKYEDTNQGTITKHCYVNSSYYKKEDRTERIGDIIRKYRDGKSYYLPGWMSVTKSRRILSKHEYDYNVFDDLTETEWDFILQELQTVNSHRTNRFGWTIEPTQTWLKHDYPYDITKITLNWQSQYLKEKT